MIHEIKCQPEYFEPLLTGDKTCEVRENDRDYQVDDILLIREFNPRTRDGYTKRSVARRITHILRDFPAVDKKYVVLSLAL